MCPAINFRINTTSSVSLLSLQEHASMPDRDRHWWRLIVTLPRGARDRQPSLFYQHYSSEPTHFLHYAVTTAGTSTANGQESSTCRSLTILRRQKEKYREGGGYLRRRST